MPFNETEQEHELALLQRIFAERRVSDKIYTSHICGELNTPSRHLLCDDDNIAASLATGNLLLARAKIALMLTI